MCHWQHQAKLDALHRLRLIESEACPDGIVHDRPFCADERAFVYVRLVEILLHRINCEGEMDVMAC